MAFDPVDLTQPGAASQPPRALLVPCREIDPQLKVEVRSCSIADRLLYLGALAMATALGDGEVDFNDLWPILIVSSTYEAVFEQGRWAPLASNARVFRWSDRAQIAKLPPALVERLFFAASRMSGLLEDEYNAAVKRAAMDPSWQGAFHLAKELGCTLGELSERMPSYEYTYWLAHHAIAATVEEMAHDAASGRAGMSNDGVSMDG